MLFALFLLCWCRPDSGRWTVEDFPNPLTEPNKCGINRKSTICDPDDAPILSNEERARVQAAIEVFEQLDVDCGKTEMGVAIMSFMKYDTAEYAKEMACGLMDKWGVGKKECNNGVVLALSVYDRKLHFCTGSGARKALPDAEIDQIIANMKSHLKKQNYGDAIESGISQAAQVINGHSYVDDQKTMDNYALGFTGCLIGIVLAGWIYSSWKERRENQRYRHCQRMLTRIEQEHATALAKQFKTFDGSCPICLEQFVDASSGTTNSSRYQRMEETRQPLATASEERSDIAPPGSVCLRCGHGFHEQCLDSWETQGAGNVRQCPVCRSTVDGTGVLRRTVDSDGTAATTLTQRTAASANSQPNWPADRMFRLNRLRYYYPEYLDTHMLARAHRDTSLVLSADSSFVHQSPSYKRALDAAQHAASATSRTTYGGGSSSGGGGGGGGW